MKAIVSKKGQVANPKKQRGRVVATKDIKKDRLESVYGILKLGRSTDEIMVELRGKPDTV